MIAKQAFYGRPIYSKHISTIGFLSSKGFRVGKKIKSGHSIKTRKISANKGFPRTLLYPSLTAGVYRQRVRDSKRDSRKGIWSFK